METDYNILHHMILNSLPEDMPSYTIIDHLENREGTWLRDDESKLRFVERYLEMNNLKAKSRKREIVDERRILMMFLVENTNATYTRIGHLFGKDHATILHHQKRHKDLMAFDKIYKNLNDAIVSNFKNYMP